MTVAFMTLKCGSGTPFPDSAKNATEEVYLEEVIPPPEFGGTFIHPADLRRVGLELTARF